MATKGHSRGSERYQFMELEAENTRLRRLVTDLLLEKLKLETLRKKTVAKGRPSGWSSGRPTTIGRGSVSV